MNKEDVLEMVSHITQIEAGMSEKEAENVRDAIGEDLFHLVCAAVPSDELETCMDASVN